MDVRDIMELLVFLTSIFCIVILGFKIANLRFKVNYYEQKFINNKVKFTEEEWRNIQKMIDSKENPLLKRK